MSAKEIVNLPEGAIKDAYCRIYRESGDRFLSHLAAAVVSANEDDFCLLRPIALLFLDKYQLLDDPPQTAETNVTDSDPTLHH